MSRYDRIVLLFLNIFWIACDADIYCHGITGSIPVPTTVCNGLVNEPIHLICLDHQPETLEWYFNETNVAIGQHNTGKHDNVMVNKCCGKKSSLTVGSCYNGANHVILCEQSNTTLAKFMLECKDPELFIFQKDDLKVGTEGVDIDVTCHLQHALAPVTLEWIVGNKTVKYVNFAEPTCMTSNFSIRLTIDPENVSESITCRSYGKYTDDISRSILLAEKRSLVSGSPAPLVVFVVFLVMFVPAVTYYAVQRLKHCETNNVLSDFDLMSYISERRNRQLLTTISMNNRQGNTNRNMRRLQRKGSKPPKSLAKPDLRVKIQSGTHFEYWTAFTESEGAGFTCFAKKLPDDATSDDKKNMKTLADSVSLLRTDERFVKILYISTQMSPLAIFYETMSFGTLKAHLISHTWNEIKATASGSQLNLCREQTLKELLITGVHIADAMQFLVSKKFGHPALSPRKVLLTSNGSCKLYDFYPNELCMTRIKQLLQKDNPPIAWMATEIFVMEQYLPKSDSWSFGVFLWELFSMGDQPPSGVNPKDFKMKVLEQFHLSKPEICPNDVFLLVESCWEKNHKMRPLCGVLLQTMKSLYERMDDECH